MILVRYDIFRRGIALVALAVLGVAGMPAVAQAQENGDGDEPRASYARYYGDGLRHHAEGRYGDAVEHLFRAYALQQRPQTLELIVDSYDRMGFCDAASRQVERFQREHVERSAPTLDRCASTGELAIECSRPGTTVRVDDRFEVPCGETISLPVGEHRLSGALVETPRSVHIEAGGFARAELGIREPRDQRRPQIARISEELPQVERLGVERLGVERLGVEQLGGTVGEYATFQGHDGLYHIFILPAPAGAGTVLPFGLRPEVLRLCDSDERFDRETHNCEKSERLQIKKME